MKSLRVIFRYVSNYPRLIFAYFSFNIISNLFSLVSLGLLSPFLLLIFKKNDTLATVSNGTGFFEKLNPVNILKVWLYEMIKTPAGEIKALAVICLLVLFAIILKNIFLF